MKDRALQFPNRYKLVPVDGTTDIVDIIPAPGEVTEVGTPINKATLLTDDTAFLYGFSEDAVPDDIFKHLAPQYLRQSHSTFDLMISGRFS